MARRKVESETVNEDEQPVRTRPVRVHETRSYIEEQPVEEVVIEEEAGAYPNDPFAMFNEIVTTNQQASMRIWRLPNYEIDGRASPAGTEREYCGSIPYEADNAALLDQVQQRVPMGGTIQLELYADGRIQKRGLLKLMKVAQAAQPAYNQPGTHLVINQPAATAQQAPAASPVDVMREQMSLAKDLVSMAKDLAPVAPVVHVGGNGASAESNERPIEEKLFETVLIKALESGKTPIDKIFEAMSGRRNEPSWMEAIVELGKAFAPTLDKIATQFLANQQQAMRLAAQQASAAAPTNLGTLPAEPIATESVIEGEQSQPPPPVDPVGRAWMRVLYRLLEDCTEHVALSQVSADRISVIPSAEAIADLADRFPEQLGPTIEQVLAATPDDVLTMCGMLLGEAGRAHIEAHLKPFPAAAAWIEELQQTCKRILSEEDEANGDLDSQPDSTSSKE